MKINAVEYLEDGAARQFPKRIAIEDGDRRWTFEQLRKDARNCGAQLIRRLDAINEPIAVFLPKCAETVIADLGILCSGNIYSNLDVKSPHLRIRNILDKIGPALCITSRALFHVLHEIGVPENQICCIEDLLEAADGDADQAISSRLGRIVDTDPLCIINTSGSTGTPKGVALCHRGTIDFMEWVFDTFNLDEHERIGSLSPFYFDIYTLELFLCLARGSTLVLVPDQAATFPAKLIEFLEQRSISFLFWVPSIMVTIANMGLLGHRNPALRNVFFAGEVFPTRQLNQWRRAFPTARFVNLYGPIEIHVDCTYYVVDREFGDDEPLPIGRPCRNTDILILSEDDRLCADNEHGELCVRGSSLALGYWNDPEKTASVFVQNPLQTRFREMIYRTGDLAYRNECGDIYLVGRRDFQIKHLGYRINLQEIEHLVHSVEGIGQACVLYQASRKEITVFYESLAGGVTPAGIRAHLATVFPKYMVPTVYHHMDSLPRNPNGKIDRNRLTALLQTA